MNIDVARFDLKVPAIGGFCAGIIAALLESMSELNVQGGIWRFPLQSKGVKSRSCRPVVPVASLVCLFDGVSNRLCQE